MTPDEWARWHSRSGGNSPVRSTIWQRFSAHAARQRVAQRAVPEIGPQRLQTRRSGRLRRRIPVAAKMALATAGAIGGVPGSPTPPTADAPLSTRWTAITGASARRTAS